MTNHLHPQLLLPFVILLVCLAQLGQAQGSGPIAKKIAGHEQRINELEQDIKNLPAIIAKHDRLLSVAKTQRRKANRELKRESENYNATVNLNNDEAKIEFARFKLFLAEKEASRKGDMLRDAEGKLAKQKQLLAYKKAQLVENRNGLVAQQSLLQAQEEQRENLALQKAARKKLAREKAAQRKLAQQQAAQRKTLEKKAAKKRKAQEKARKRALAAEKRNNKAHDAKIQRLRKPKVISSNGVHSIAQDDIEISTTGNLPGRAKQARGQNQVLQIYPKNNSAAHSSIDMKFVGQSQFRAEAPVKTGPSRFIIGSRRWTFDIPLEDDGATYVFIFDTRKNGGKRLVMYNKDFGKR